MRRSGSVLLLSLLVIFALAFIIRIYPLVWSPYPYNIDGLGEAVMAGDIYANGDFSIPADSGYRDSYIVDMPIMTSLIAMSSQIVGIEPMVFSQVLIAVIGAISCVAGALVVHMITGSQRIALLGGLLLALLGTYVFCTASVWKETLGLTMMIFIAGFFIGRKDFRLRIALTVALVAMTFIHHHSAVLTYLFFSFAVAGDAYLSRKNRSWSWNNYVDIGTMVLLWVLAVGYYQRIDLPYYGFLTPDEDLYLLIAVSCAMSLVLFAVLSRQSSKGSPRKLIRVSIPVVGLAILSINYFRPIFPGIPPTEPMVFIFAAAYLVLLLPMWYGAERLLQSRERWISAYLALIFAPLSMILFAFLRALDATSHMIVYRTFDFLDLAMALMFATGAVIMVRNLKKIGPVVIASLILVIAVTTPLAFQTEKLFGVHNQTYEYEVDAFDWMKSMSPVSTMDSDQRLSTTAGWLFNISSDADLSYRIEIGMAVSSYDWLVLKSSWTTVGAQQFPLGQNVIDKETFDAFLSERNVLLVSGPIDNQLIVAVESS